MTDLAAHPRAPHAIRASFVGICAIALASVAIGLACACSSSSPSQSKSQPGPTNPAAPPSGGSGPQYYVSTSGSDSNNGQTTATAWATLRYACAAVSAGATITVLPGTYSETPFCNNSGAAGSPITIQAQYPATLNAANRSIFAPSNSTEAVITLVAGTSYLVIDGFEVTNPNASVGILNWGSYNTASRNVVHDVGTAVPCNGDGGAGIESATYTASDDDEIANVVYNIGMNFGLSSNTCNFWHGIYHTNLRGHIYNNIVSNTQSVAIELNHNAQNVMVVNNTIFNYGSSSGGLCYGSGIWVSNQGDYPVSDYDFVANNIVVNGLGCAGILEMPGGVGTHNYYVNNDSYNNAGGTIQLFGGIEVGEMSADPGFLNYQANGSGTYSAASASAFMVGSGVSLQTAETYNAGVSGEVPGAVPATGFAGNTRPNGTSWDIGAYQW
jgi:hypothetical protein